VPGPGPARRASRRRGPFLMSALRRYAWLATWVSLSLFLLLQVIDAWQRGAPLVFWLAKLLPLLIFVPGMWRDKLRSYIWLSFVSLGYFVLAVERVFAQPGSYLASGSLVAIVVLFIASMLYVRWRARELRELSSREGPPGDLDE